jgi:hypothetical protein
MRALAPRTRNPSVTPYRRLRRERLNNHHAPADAKTASAT